MDFKKSVAFSVPNLAEKSNSPGKKLLFLCYFAMIVINNIILLSIACFYNQSIIIIRKKQTLDFYSYLAQIHSLVFCEIRQFPTPDSSGCYISNI